MNPRPRIATVGMFDGVHRGHRALLARLKSEAEASGLEACVFTFDRHPLELIAPDKAPGRLMSLDDKVAELRDAAKVDVEVLNFTPELRRLTAEEFLTMLRDRYGVKALLMGFNHRFGSDRQSDISYYENVGKRLGVEIIRADELRDSSAIDRMICSSSIREAIAEGDVKAAADMLGHPYLMHGHVVSGKQLGRTIGFPTANIDFDVDGVVTPMRGVYAVDVVLPNGERRRGMLNLGVRPTVDHSAHPRVSAEVHIIDWEGDLYGSAVTLEYLTRLRDEQHFPSLESLRQQLAADRMAALQTTRR